MLPAMADTRGRGPVESLDEPGEQARELLRGAVDIHVHAAPDPYTDRKLDARALLIQAKAAGMRGLVLKSHEYPTQPLAWALGSEIGGISVYGGLSLDHAVGGLNPEAVSVSLRLGARVIWMPTFDAEQWRRYRGEQVHSAGPGIVVLDEGGSLLPVCNEILDLIEEHDAVLASGHLSVEETAALLGESRRRGIRSVITHASFWIPVEVQRELAEAGAYIEQCAITSQGERGDEAFETIAEQVRAVGPEHVILSTDLGQAANPEPPLGFGLWIERFLGAGFSAADVGRMARENPVALLE